MDEGRVSSADGIGGEKENSIGSVVYRRLHVPIPLRAPEMLSSNSRAKELYWDRSHYDSHQSQIAALHNSSTLYIGNLSFSTQSRHLTAHFAMVGPVKRVFMGLDRFQKTPCGFAFVEYVSRRHALAAVATLSGTKLDGSVIRVELDAGFQPGRQYGRGAKGGQVRHDRKSATVGQKRTRNNSDNSMPLSPSTNLASEGDKTAPEGSYVPSAPSYAGAGEDYYGTEENDNNDIANNNGNEDEQDNGDEMADDDLPSPKRQRT